VGKSSILRRYCKDEFRDNSSSTIGIECYHRMVRLGPLLVRFDLWDTAGQERFDSLTSQYLRGCSGLICVFDVNLVTSYDNIERYIDQFYQQLGVRSDSLLASGDESPPVLLLANKTDVDVSDNEMRRNARDGLLSRACELAQQHQWLQADVSAKTGNNVEAAIGNFLQLVHRYHQTKERMSNAHTASRSIKPIESLRNSGLYGQRPRSATTERLQGLLGSGSTINVMRTPDGQQVPVSVHTHSTSTTVVMPGQSPKQQHQDLSMDQVIELGEAARAKKVGCGC